MRRQIARLRPLWFALIPISILANGLAIATFDVGAPGVVMLAATVALLVLIFVTPPRSNREPVTVAPPVRGRWAVLNSPGSTVPSHGTRTNGQSYAVDICGPTGDKPLVSGFGPGTRPEEFSCFGEPVYAGAPGEVSRVVSRRRDHRARDTWPAFVWLLTGEGILRSFGGFGALGGNHVIVTEPDGTSTVYAHLQQGSPAVREGQHVEEGTLLGRVGNTGNTSMPHLHIHRQERPNPAECSGVPMLWRDIEIEDEPDVQFAKYAKEPGAKALAGFPPTAAVFRVG